MRELWLSLDLSGAHGSAALHEVSPTSVSVMREVEFGDLRSQSEEVLGAVSALLGDLELASIARFLTTSGPGSFTGLRIAAATLKGFAFALNRPVDTVGAAEARALAWLSTQPKRSKSVHVYTHLAVGKFDRVTFDFSEGSAEAHLTDGRVAIAGAIPFPLRASHLGQCLLLAKSRRTFACVEEWISFSPEYLGGRF